MKLGRWSTTPGSNNATPPDGWPEGQAPSTINDCAREMMASIRTAFNDLQYFDQDMTPTYINATTFSVIGNQTSAIHAGRRLKMFDGGAINYGTVSTASFTTVTTIQVDVDNGTSITSSLSSFALSVIANTNNPLPRATTLTLSGLTVATSLSVGGTVFLGSTLAVSGDTALGGGLAVGGPVSCSATIAAANVLRSFASFSASTGATLAVRNSFNVSSISRSDTGVYRINFTTSFPDANYGFNVEVVSKITVSNPGHNACWDTILAGSFKMRLRNPSGIAVDPTIDTIINASFWRA